MTRCTTRFATHIALLAGVLASAACESATAPAEDLEVVVEAGIHRPAFHPPFAVTRAGAQITVNGTFETLCAPTALHGEAYRDGDLLVVTIAENPAQCFPATGVDMYRATVSGLVTVPLHVSVVHRWTGTNRQDQIVFEGTFN